jgi:ankyrin repeat protein
MPNGATAVMLAAGMDTKNNEDRRGVNVIDYGKPEPESKVLPSVEIAFKAAGDANAVNKEGDTALHAAVTHRYESVVEFLASHGADVNTRNQANLTPLGTLTRRKGNERQPVSGATASAVYASAATEDPATGRIAEILRKHGAEN